MINVLVGLAPVLVFLAVLVFLDSFKLLRPRFVLAAIVVGGLAAALASPLNAALMDGLSLSTRRFSRYGAPLTEELLKSAYIILLIRRRRVGFLVDAAIHGFAVGTGFGLVENTYYLLSLDHASAYLWIVRGFGTAIVHGSTTSIFAMISKAMTDRHERSAFVAFLPGLTAAAALHSLFNHFVLNPLLATALLLAVVPLLMIAVFDRSREATRSWMSEGFHGDLEFLSTILSGGVSRTRVGAYLHSLKDRFPGPVVADMLCLIRINLELSLRGKGVLIAREAGLDLPVGDDVRANLDELRYLEKAIGATGLLAIEPLLKRSSRDLWHFYMLGQEGAPARGWLRRRGDSGRRRDTGS